MLKKENHIQVEESKIDNSVTTTFVEDSVVAEVDYKTKTVTDSIIIRDQAIVDFLAKPYLVVQGAWQTTDLANASLFPLGFISPSAMLLSNALWTNKIQGFNMIRGTAVLRVQINANPFQTGKLLLHFLPCAASFGGSGSTYETMHNLNLTTKRQQPSVEIDCRDTVGILKIPYVAPSDFYSISDAMYDWGRFYLSVYAPLGVGSGGATTVEYSVYLSFEDFEMAAPIVPQAGSNRKVYKAHSLKEIEDASTGPLTKALSSTSKIANSLTSIPVIGQVAETVSWATSIASGVASIFGWSKPRLENPPTRVSNAFDAYGATSDGVDPSYPLALTSCNQIKMINEASLTDQDEMSFAFLKRVSTYISTVEWEATDASGTLLLSSFAVSPMSLRSSTLITKGTSSTTVYTGPPINYLASKFKYWRGSIKLNIKIAKTDYHSGRLELVWTPISTAPTVPTLLTSQLALREVIDLRTGNEIEMVLPYMLSTEYIPTSTPSGYLQIRVLNELKAPDSAPQSINLLMHYGGGEDFEFQVPAQIGSFTMPFSPQGKEGGSVVLVEDDIGSSAQTSQNTEHAQLCVGEMFTSVKQILNRNSTFYHKAAVPAAGFSIWPFFCSSAYLPLNGALTVPNVGGDPYSHIAPMYAFYRGSARVKWVTKGGAYGEKVCLDTHPTAGVTSVFGAANAVLSPESLYAWGPTQTSMAGFGSVAFTNAGVQNMSAVVPYYSRTKCSLVIPNTSDDVIPNDISQPAVKLNAVCTPNAYDGASFGRSFRDDFQLSYFIGCPPYLADLA